jgi:hypothetical protein
MVTLSLSSLPLLLRLTALKLRGWSLHGRKEEEEGERVRERERGKIRKTEKHQLRECSTYMML